MTAASTRKSRNSRTSPSRRSPCPVACSLDIIGDKWTLLIIRDMVLGAERYKDFASSPEGIPTNILADRLKRLRENDIIERVPATDGSRHPAYHLTAKGKALSPVLKTLRDWGLAWEPGTEARLK